MQQRNHAADLWEEHAADEIRVAETIEKQLRGYLAGNETVEPARLAWYAEAARDAADALTRARDSFDPRVEFSPNVEVNLDGRDWLLDTDRDYVDQLNAYRRHAPAHKRRPEIVLQERACAYCGEPIRGLRVTARYCSQQHAQLARRQRRRAS